MGKRFDRMGPTQGAATTVSRAAPWEGSARAAAVIARLRHLEGPLLPMLHALQEEFGYVPREVEPMLAEALDLSRAEVFGVISFYHDFRRERPGRHVLRICRAEACQAMGAGQLARDLLGRLGLEWGGRTADGALTVEPTFCLGLCACAPAVQFDGEPVARVDADALERMVGEARA